MSLLPLFSQQSAIEAGEKGSHPKDEKNISKTIIDIFGMSFNTNGNGEDKANKKRSPKIPISQLSDSSLSISRNHEECKFDLGANTKELSFLKIT